MSFINVQDISKTFKVAKRRSGLKATLKSFFKRNYIYVEAVRDISFQIEKGEIVGYILYSLFYTFKRNVCFFA